MHECWIDSLLNLHDLLCIYHDTSRSEICKEQELLKLIEAIKECDFAGPAFGAFFPLQRCRIEDVATIRLLSE